MKTLILCALLALSALPAVSQGAKAAGQPKEAPQQSGSPAAPAEGKAAAATIDPAKETAIRNLFRVQNTAKLMQQIIANMSTSMKPMLNASLPAGEYREKLIDLFFQKFQSKVKVEQLIDLAVPVYDRNFSKEEIVKLTEFYESLVGQKFLAAQPQIIAETQTASMKMGQDMGRQAMMEVLDENPDLKKALENAAAPQR